MESNNTITTMIPDEKGGSIVSQINRLVRSNMKQNVLLLALLAVCLLFAFLTGGIFISVRNLSNLFMQTAVVGVLSCGMVMVIVGGQIDLSIASIVGVMSVVMAKLMTGVGIGTIPAILIAVAIGMIAGLINGYLIARWNIAAFIVTLGTAAIFRGLVYWLTAGRTLGPLNESFTAIGSGYLPQLFFKDVPFNDTSIIFAVIVVVLFIISDLKRRNTRKKYGFKVLPIKIEIIKISFLSLVILAISAIMVFYRGIPFSILALLVVIIAVSYMAKNTAYGSQIYAMGGNREAAILSGINVKRNTVLLFVLMGFICAIAGVLSSARINAAGPASGLGLEFRAITAVIIGGTSFSGGVGNIPGAIIGSLLIGALNNGMSLMNLGVEFQTAIGGLVLIIALWVDMINKKKA